MAFSGSRRVIKILFREALLGAFSESTILLLQCKVPIKAQKSSFNQAQKQLISYAVLDRGIRSGCLGKNYNCKK